MSVAKLIFVDCEANGPSCSTGRMHAQGGEMSSNTTMELWQLDRERNKELAKAALASSTHERNEALVRACEAAMGVVKLVRGEMK